MEDLVRIATLLFALAPLAGPALAGDDLQLRVERLESSLAELREENRALREQLRSLLPTRVASTEVGAVPIAAPVPVPTASASPSPRPAGTKITVGGQVRMRSEYRNNADLKAGEDDGDGFVAERARVGVRVETQHLRAVVEVQDARHWGTEASTVSNDGNVDLHQAFLTLPAVGPLSLTLGRQELAYGDERLLGALDWATTGRSFDGGVARYGWSGGSVDGLAALVQDRRTAGRGRGDQALLGFYGRFLRGSPGRELDAYVLNLGDGAKVKGETAGEDPSRITTLGARARYGRATGFQAAGEGAIQLGHRGPDAHDAHALNLSLGYGFPGKRQPQLSLTLDTASGDRDPRDGRSGEFHNLFPTNHPFYGFADLLGWRNMRAVRATFRLSPRAGHQLSLDGHRFWLEEARGSWRDAGGALLGQDVTGRSGRDLGRELDLLYRVGFKNDLGLLLGYSIFLPGRFAESVRGGDTHRFGYAQLLLKF